MQKGYINMQNLDIDRLTANIYNLMQSSNTTQVKLAAAIGMTQSNLSRALSSKEGQCFTLEQVYKISQYFNVSVDSLLGEEKPIVSTEREICELFTQLIEKRQIICTKASHDDEVYTPYMTERLDMDCNIEKVTSEYASFHFPNYENPGPLDRFTESEIDEMRDTALWGGNAHNANQQINGFFEKYLQIYEMYLHNHLSEELFHEITGKFLDDLI